jgi:hypothetical protein
MISTKFSFRNKEYDLLELAGENNCFSPPGKPNILVVTKNGTLRLSNTFPNVEISFGDVQQLNYGDETRLALLATAFEVNNDAYDHRAPSHSAYGEVSLSNTDEKWGKMYPIAILENRARNRAFFRFLGLENVFSEEESTEFVRSDEEQKEPSESHNSTSNGNGSGDVKKKLFSRIKMLCSEQNMSDEQRLDIYEQKLGTRQTSEIFEKSTIEQLNEIVSALENQ